MSITREYLSSRLVNDEQCRRDYFAAQESSFYGMTGEGLADATIYRAGYADGMVRQSRGDWIAVCDMLPDVEQRLDKPCELEGKPLPPLNITRMVQVFDGKRVTADCIEWFDGGQPLKGYTHWKPLDAPPASTTHKQQEAAGHEQ